jgi:urease accessory protein
LEWAVETGEVANLQGLLDYVTGVLERGGGWVDSVLFAHAWRATPRAGETAARAESDSPAGPITPVVLNPLAHSHVVATPAATAELDAIAQLAAAFRSSSETALESRQQGNAFLDVTRKAWPHPTLDTFAARQAAASVPVAHCVAVAIACAAHDVALTPALHAYLHAAAANLVSAGARLIPLGQTQAQIAIARLSPVITGVVERALATSLDDLGTAAPAIELCSLRHETQYTRLFRS